MSEMPNEFVLNVAMSGGTSTSHTLRVMDLELLLDAVPRADAQTSDYWDAVVEANVLSKGTDGGRRRDFRHLKELFLLSPDCLCFRALHDLWWIDHSARPLLACLSALTQDAVFRASADVIVRTSPGDELTSRDLAAAVEEQFPTSYKASTLAKIGRNTFSSWEQTGHLRPHAPSIKQRQRAVCQPSNVAYALLLGHLQGARGQALFETLWAQVLDQPRSHLYDLATAASQAGLLEFRNAGGVVEVGFTHLLRPFEGMLL
jgi:hypothetical protein